MTVTIHVTREHIQKGQPRRPQWCPIALALRAAGAPCPSVVPYTGAWFWNYDMRRCQDHLLPRVAATFASDFDAGREVFPISFKVEFPA